MTAIRTLIDNFSLLGLFICIDRAFMGRSTPTTVFDGAFDTLPIQCRHIEHMHEGVWFKKSFLTK